MDLKRAWFFALTIFLVSATAQAELELSEETVEALHTAAENGDASAQLEYGKSLERTSPDEAFRWLTRAGEQGLGEGWFRIAYALNRGTLYYERAAELGYGEAVDYGLDDLLFRAGAKADIQRAKHLADLARQKWLAPGDHRNLDVVDMCFAAGKPSVPEADQPSAAEVTSFKSGQHRCIDYHEGLGVPRDDGAYRKCLLAEDDRNNNALAEIYANGWGVSRDVKRGTALLCHGSVVPAELEAAVLDLNRPSSGERKDAFSFCEHATSRLHTNWCANDAAYVSDQRRIQAFDAVVKRFSSGQKALFSRALADYEAFARKHANAEPCYDGRMAGALTTSESRRVLDDMSKWMAM